MTSQTVNFSIFKSSVMLFCWALLLQLLCLPSPSLSSDADPLQDFCVADLSACPSPPMNGFPCKPISDVSGEDFAFRGLVNQADTSNTFGSKVTDGSVLAYPGINALGLSVIRVDIEPGGINPPHVHPRSTEILVMIEGTLLVGFVTADDKYYSTTVDPGEVFVIPRAMVHFQINRGKSHAHFIAGFNSQRPGVITIPTNLFSTSPTITNDILTRAFQISDKVADQIKRNLRGANPPSVPFNPNCNS